MPKEALVNVSAALELPIGPRQRVSEMQVKLHHWAAADSRTPDMVSWILRVRGGV